MTADPRQPTYRRLAPDGLAPVLDRNIRTLEERRRRQRAEAGLEERAAEAITRFTGSMLFVYLHLAVVAGWIAVNAGLVPGLSPFDPTFVILATTASVEAIFLSTFVLISQNRAAAAADRRADLDLQINLLAEHEITRLISLTRAIAERLDVTGPDEETLDAAERDVAPEKVLEELEARAPEDG